jgi:hypothetical protein
MAVLNEEEPPTLDKRRALDVNLRGVSNPLGVPLTARRGTALLARDL